MKTILKAFLISLLLSVDAAGGTIDLDGATITGQLPTANATTVLTAAKVGASYTGIVNTNYAQTNDSALGSAVSWADTQHRATLTGNATVSFSNVPASGTVGLITIKITQDGTGGRTVTWPASVITAPQINPVASSVTTVTLLVDDYVDATTPKIRAFSDYQGDTVINGTLAVAGAITNASVEVPTISSTSTLTNKRTTARVTTIVSSATPTVNTDNCDVVSITAQAVAITDFVTNLTGSPQPFDRLEFSILDDNSGPMALTWATPFIGGPVAYPTTTVQGKTLHVYVERNAANTAWRCMATSSDL